MKIVTWNCNGAFRRKFARIAATNADIYVIQECENPATSTDDYRGWAGDYLWSGKSSSKGLGIFVKNGLSIQPLHWEDHGLQQFLPARIGNAINLLAVWAKNDAKMGYIGQFWQYLEHHSRLFDRDLIICGDLNSNAVWDKRGRAWNHSECIATLNQIGFESAYHKATGEQQGAESQPTLYLQRNMGKPYHIDYIFTHSDLCPANASTVTIGQAKEWLSLSDHMPVVVNLQPRKGKQGITFGAP